MNENITFLQLRWRAVIILGNRERHCDRFAYHTKFPAKPPKLGSLLLINFETKEIKAFGSENVELDIASFYIEFYSTSLEIFLTHCST